MDLLNKGKFSVGSGAAISYGDQSPADDAVPLAWRAGDTRIFQSANPAAHQNIKWVCIVAGTPGTWQLVRIPGFIAIIQQPLTFNGLWPNAFTPGGEVSMAPATADWVEAGEVVPQPNVIPVQNFDLIESTGGGPCFLGLQIWINRQVWDVTIPAGITFNVYKEDFTLLGTGTVNADPLAVGKFNPVLVALPAGTIDSNAAGLQVTMTVDAGAGAGEIHLNGFLGLYRDFVAPFPS